MWIRGNPIGGLLRGDAAGGSTKVPTRGAEMPTIEPGDIEETFSGGGGDARSAWRGGGCIYAGAQRVGISAVATSRQIAWDSPSRGKGHPVTRASSRTRKVRDYRSEG